jgi:hypothetical protein
MSWASVAALILAGLTVLGADAPASHAAQGQTVTFSSLAPARAIVGGPTYHVVAAASSNLPVTIAIAASSKAVCTISGSTVTFIGPGTCAIDATQPGGGQFGGNEYVEPFNSASARQSFAVIAPNSSFTAGKSSFEPKTGRVIFIEKITDPGTFSWLLSVPNGKFGVYASSRRCKAGYARFAGRCRPSKVIFATGSAAVPAGVIIFKLRPSASALKALKTALGRNRGVPVTATFTFQSALGGSPVSHTQSITDRLKRK